MEENVIPIEIEILLKEKFPLTEEILKEDISVNHIKMFLMDNDVRGKDARKYAKAYYEKLEIFKHDLEVMGSKS